MTRNAPSERDQRLLARIERLRRCDNPTVDGPEEQISLLLVGLSELASIIRAEPQDERDGRLLLDISHLRRCNDPSIDGPEAQISVLLTGLSALAARIDPPSLRDAIARIIDDEIWDGDGDYPLDRERIATRRESAYERADRIIALGDVS